MHKKVKTILSVLLMAVTITGTVPVHTTIQPVTVEAASMFVTNFQAVTVGKGKKVKLDITRSKPANGKNVSMGTSGSSKLKWSSSNHAIATVSKNGVVTGKKNGKATITAKMGGTRYCWPVTVRTYKVSKIK